MASPYTVVYIAGSGRCGSTLLDLLLNGHSQILGLGELSTLNTAFDPFNATDSMVEQFESSYLSFWQQLRVRYEQRTALVWKELTVRHPRWRRALRWDAPQVSEWARQNEILFSAAHEVAGTRILTDASKWTQRLYLLQRSGRFDLRVLYMVRDGRAVTNSYVERYDDFKAGLRTWITTAVTCFVLRRRRPQASWLTVRYEDLATDPEAELVRICQFLGVDFEPEMTAYRSHAYYGLGGNPLTKRDAGEQISLDERWRQRLSRRHRRQFAVAGGWLNLLYGYRR